MMRQSELQSPPALRVAAKRSPAPLAVNRVETAKRISRRQAWITDPHALLSALEQAERAAQVSQARMAPVEETIRVAAREPAPSQSQMCAPPPPALREDERIGHASSEGVVVIIRRRRAA